ncbi:DUF4344 domain-containing metallopeptidase [Streptomyces sp. NPDC021093]|uniref:DUF4344 domain-containing metallopeptidase n=1 Tax=Streptomyces sp. NPDC021093 TaxID=3365112 RepID=UPI00379D498A
MARNRTRVRTGAGAGARTRTAGVAVAVALLTAAGSACQAPPAVSVPRQVVTVRYEDPAPADQRDAAFLRERKTAEEAASALAGFLDWGDRAPVPLVVKSCAGEGSSYDPEARRIEICYDEVTETRELFREGGHRRATADDVRAVLIETLFHESAHALVDVLGLRLPGSEEDLADQFAALMLLREGEPGARRLRAAAEAWRMSAEVYEDDEEAATDGEATADEHAPDQERAVNQLCYAYGSAREGHRDPAGTGGLPAARAAGCEKEWSAVRTKWTNALQEVLAGPGSGGNRP